MMSSVPLVNEAGEARRVGIEIEYADVGIELAARFVQALFGGDIKKINDYESVVETADGPFRVELDNQHLKRLGQQRAESEQQPDLLKQLQEEVLTTVAGDMIPFEIVTPPLKFDCFAKLDQLVEQLHQAGAKGTDDALRYAFGVHFNPEAPSTQAPSILAYLRAFSLLYPWLKRRLAVDWSRRITPFIDAFPDHYNRQILQPDYRPDLEQLIADYLLTNPTRNRALDMLPLFAYLRREQVLLAVDDPLIKSRPTYHYRLGNSQIGTADWQLSEDWQYWLLVERLAQDQERQAAMAEAYLDQGILSSLSSSWSERTEQWLSDYDLPASKNR